MAEAVEHSEYCMFEFGKFGTGDDDATCARHMARRMYLNAVSVAPQLLVRYGVVCQADGTMTPTPRTYSGWGYWILAPWDRPPVAA